MNCSDFRSILVEHLDGRLAPDAEAAAHSHLDSCPGCRREAELHRRTWELAGRIEAIEPGAAFAASVRRRVRRPRILALAGSCAAAAALVAALLLVPRHKPESVDPGLATLPQEDRRLLEELARDRTWELADNIDVIRAYELIESNGGAPAPDEDH